MTQQLINIGVVADDGTGDQLRSAFQKTNLNFSELYSGAWTSFQAFTAPVGPTSFGVMMGTTDLGWLNHYTLPYGPYLGIVSPIGGAGGIMSAVRTADWRVAAATRDIITQQIYAIHDATTNPGYFGIWGTYILAVRTATADPTITVMGTEMSFLNSGAPVQGDPYDDPPGWNTLLRLDSGLPNGDLQHTVSNAIEIATIGATFYSGLKVNTNALSPSTSGFYEAIQLASHPTGSSGPGHSIVWYGASGTITGVIEVDTTGALDLHGTGGIATADVLALLNTTQSSSTSTGSLVASGGIGVAKNGVFGGAVSAAGVMIAQGLVAAGDPGGAATTNTFTSQNSTSISTGVGSVKMSTATPATNAGWIKIYIGTAPYWIPAWAGSTPP